MNERNNEQQAQPFNDKIPYSFELIKRISAVLDSCQYNRFPYQEINNLFSVLLPEIKETIAPEIQKLRTDLNRIKNRLPYPVITMPMQQTRPTPSKYLIDNRQVQKDALYWSDFPADIRQAMQLYFYPGQCLDTAAVLQIILAEYSRKEIEIVVRELHKRNLLLYADKYVQTGQA